MPAKVLLVEPDEALRGIVLAELGPGMEGAATVPEELAGVLLLALPSKVEALKMAAGGKARVLPLRVRAVTGSMATYLPKDVTARADVLVGVASGWGEFRRFARTMLVAAGFSGEALMVRDTGEAGWRAGLESAAAVVCDACAAAELGGRKAIVIRLLAEGMVDEVRAALNGAG